MEFPEHWSLERSPLVPHSPQPCTRPSAWAPSPSPWADQNPFPCYSRALCLYSPCLPLSLSNTSWESRTLGDGLSCPLQTCDGQAHSNELTLPCSSFCTLLTWTLHHGSGSTLLRLHWKQCPDSAPQVRRPQLAPTRGPQNQAAHLWGLADFLQCDHSEPECPAPIGRAQGSHIRKNGGHPTHRMINWEAQRTWGSDGAAAPVRIPCCYGIHCVYQPQAAGRAEIQKQG